MANTFTPLLGLVIQVVGENDQLWGGFLNDGVADLIDEVLTGRVEVDVESGDVTLTDDDGVTNQARPMFIRTTGLPGAPRVVTVPNKQKLYVFEHAVGVGQTLTVKTPNGTGVIEFSVGDQRLLFVDEVLDDVVWAKSKGGAVIPDGNFFGLSTPLIPGTITNGTAGATTFGISAGVQGVIGSLGVPITGATTVTVNSTAFEWVPDTTPLVIRPTVDADFPVWIDENGTVFECFMRVRSDGSGIEFFKCDGAAWVATSQRRLLAGNGTPSFHFSTI